MPRKNKTKLVSLDDECWRILESESQPRMQSVYVRNAIRHFSNWRKAGTHTLIKKDNIVNRFDSNNINMRFQEQQEIIKDVLDQRDEAIMKIKGLEKRLEQHIQKEKPSLKKWWHFFYVGLRK